MNTTTAYDIKFNATKEEHSAIARIAARAVKLNSEYDFQTCVMDLTACHANGNPMDFAKLESADNFNFAHDVFGIANHIDRETGKLTRCFRPRCSQPSK